MVRHKREGKNYVIKKIKTRDMNPKDLENTENEVRIFVHFYKMSGSIATEDQAYKYCRIQGFICGQGTVP